MSHTELKSLAFGSALKFRYRPQPAASVCNSCMGLCFVLWSYITVHTVFYKQYFKFGYFFLWRWLVILVNYNKKYNPKKSTLFYMMYEALVSYKVLYTLWTFTGSNFILTKAAISVMSSILL